MSFRRHLLKRIKGEKELPYIQLDYIESTGTQWIDIGLKVSNNTKVELVGKQYTSNSSLFGVNPLFVITSSLSTTDRKQLCRFRYNNTTQDTNVNILELSKITFDKNKGYINDVLLATFTEATFSSTYNAILFGRRINSSGALEEVAKQRIDYFKMWENDVLVRDMIPCIRKSDGVVCMYDLVSNSFFENEGTGLFRPGTLTHLPLYYAQLDYLDGTGTQYFNTGRILDMNTGMEIDFELSTTAGVNGSQYVMGARKTSGTKIYGFSGSTSNTLNTAIWQAHANITLISNRTLNDRHTMANKVSGAYLDGAFKGAMTRDAIDYNDIPITIFAFNSSNIHKGMRCYNAKIFDGETLERLYFPMLDPDKVPCMYDIMNDEVIYNSGTGEFTYGKIVKRETLPRGFQECEYIENAGTSYIGLGTGLSNANYTYKLKAKYTSFSGESSLLGTTALEVFTSTTRNGKVCMFAGSTFVSNADANSIFELEANKNKKIFKVNGIDYTITPNTTAISTQLFLFAYNSSNNPTLPAKARVYSLEVFNENNLKLAEFVPCLNSSGRPCMYDMVNYQTYYNLGEGEFLYGIKEPTNNLIKETMLGFPSSSDTSISVNSTYPYSYYMNDILLEEGKTYEINVRYVRTPSTTDDGTIRFRMLNEDGTFWGAPASGTYTTFFKSIALSGKVGATSISEWFTFQKAIIKPKKNCYIRPLVILGTKAKTPPCAYFVEIKEV